MGRRKAVGKELDNAQTLMYSSVVISELWVWGRRGNILIFYTLFSLKRTFYSYFSIFIKKSSCGEKKYVWELPWDNHKNGDNIIEHLGKYYCTALLLKKLLFCLDYNAFRSAKSNLLHNHIQDIYYNGTAKLNLCEEKLIKIILIKYKIIYEKQGTLFMKMEATLQQVYS